MKKTIILTALSASLLMTAGMAQAQRDPAYQAARASGAIGETPDGYLGFVASPSAAVKAMVEDLNIKRKQYYTQKAAEKGVTVQDFAFTAGCEAIARTDAGEMYQAPDGSWQTRTGNPPVRDPRCP